MDGAHTHGHGPSGLAEFVVLGVGVVLAADIRAMAAEYAPAEKVRPLRADAA